VDFVFCSNSLLIQFNRTDRDNATIYFLITTETQLGFLAMDEDCCFRFYQQKNA